MKTRTLAIVLFASLALGSEVAEADILHLKHGRSLEGKVLRTTETSIRIRIRGGGVMTVPKSQVRRVETRASAHADYADRVLKTDMNDPVSIDGLALWASQRGMGQKAKQLGDMAQGLRLELRILRARTRDSAQGFVDAYHWARSANLADEVLLWILSQGSAIDPTDSSLKLAYAKFNKDLDNRARAAARTEELRRRPHYAMPTEGKKSGPSQTVQAHVEMARINSSKRRSRTSAQADQDRSWVARMRALRQAELETQLKTRRTRRKRPESTGGQDQREAGTNGERNRR
jgi:hypothetical protein